MRSVKQQFLRADPAILDRQQTDEWGSRGELVSSYGMAHLVKRSLRPDIDEGRAPADWVASRCKRIGEFQLVQAMLADSQAEVYAGWSMVQDCANRFDDKAPGQSDPEVAMRASCCKLFCTEMVGRVADRGVQVHGGSGYITEFPVERFYRDVRLLRLYEGTTQIQQIIIGRALVGRN